MNSAALPPPELLPQQAAWLAPARSRLLRQAAIVPVPVPVADVKERICSSL